MSRPTFASMEEFLTQLGFHIQVVPGSHVLFQHAEAGAWIMLRLYKREEPVLPSGLAYIRHTLDTWGIMGREQFDEEIRQRSLAG